MDIFERISFLLIPNKLTFSFLPNITSSKNLIFIPVSFIICIYGSYIFEFFNSFFYFPQAACHLNTIVIHHNSNLKGVVSLWFLR